MGLRFEAWILAQTDLNAGEESWLRMIGSQFRANADNYSGPDAAFIAEQFAFHPFQQLGGMAQAVRVFGHEARMQAVIDSLNEHMFAPRDDVVPTSPSPLQPAMQ